MKTENPPAFPLGSDQFAAPTGMTLLDYFIAHAPETPQWEFTVEETTDKGHHDRIAKAWATEWAKEQLNQRSKHLTKN